MLRVLPPPFERQEAESIYFPGPTQTLLHSFSVVVLSKTFIFSQLLQETERMACKMFVMKRGKPNSSPTKHYLTHLPLSPPSPDGRKECVMFDKITSRISKLCYGLNADFVEPVSTW